MSLTKKVGINFLAQSGGRVVSTVVSIVVIALLTKYLGPENYGVYALATVIAGIGATLVDGGVLRVALNEMSAKTKRAVRVASITFSTQAIYQTVVFLGLAAVVLALPYDVTTKVVIEIILLGVYINSFSSMFTLLFQHNLEHYLNALLELVIKVVSLAGVVYAVNKGFGLIGIASVQPVATFVGLLFVVGVYFKKRYSFRFAWDKSQFLNLLKKSWPLVALALLGKIHGEADTIMLSLFRDNFEVGIYALPYKVLQIINQLPGLYIAAIFPIVANYYSSSNDSKFHESLNRSFLFLAFLMFPAAIGIFVLAPDIVLLISSESFLASVGVLRILILVAMINFMKPLLGNMSIIVNKQGLVAKATLIAVAFNIALNVIFIPMYGFTAAAVTTLITATIGLGLMAMYLNEDLKLLRYVRTVAKPLLPAILMGGAVYVMQLQAMNLFVMIAVGAAVYILLSFIFKTIPTGEIKRFIR